MDRPGRRFLGARLLIGGDQSENTPRWSPDGKQLAFISTRGGSAQIYLADSDGTNVKQITKLAAGVQPPMVFSPDGERSRSCRMSRPPARTKRATPVSRTPRKRILSRFTPLRDCCIGTGTNGVTGCVITYSWSRRAAATREDLTPGDFDSPPTQQEDESITFTPDGHDLVFVSNREGPDREAWSTNNDVWSVPAGRRRREEADLESCRGRAAARSRATASYLIVRAQRRPGFESDRWYLDVYDRSTGNRRTVFETPDLSVSDFRVSRDGRSIVFTASDHGTDNLYQVPFDGGAPQRIAAGGSISSPGLADTFAVFSKSALTAPAELFRVALTGGGATTSDAGESRLVEGRRVPDAGERSPSPARAARRSGTGS